MSETPLPSADDLRRVALLEIVNDWAQPDPEVIATLPKPYSKNSDKGNCNVCGGYHGLPAVHLDYMGHADVTLALIAVDPEWTLSWGWHSAAGPIDAFALTNPGEPTTILAELTVLGVTRPCVGTLDFWKGANGLKELIGDALRNGAMRFGIATLLWSKAQREGADPDAGTDDGARRSSGSSAEAAAAEPFDPWPIITMKRHALARFVEPHFAGAHLDDDAIKEIANDMWLETVGEIDSDATFDVPTIRKFEGDFVSWLKLRHPDPHLADPLGEPDNPHDGAGLLPLEQPLPDGVSAEDAAIAEGELQR